MRVLRSVVLMTIAWLLAARAGSAQTTATQTVTFQVTAINQISVSGNPGALTISSVTAGSAPTSVSDATTTWAVSTNQTGAKITGSIPSAMPTGVTLSVNLGAPTGATSAGAQLLGTSAVDLVTGITKLNETGKTVTYTLAATSAAGVIASDTRVVTFTITGGT